MGYITITASLQAAGTTVEVTDSMETAVVGALGNLGYILTTESMKL